MKLKEIKTLGIVFGTFAPLHIGHLDIITQAKRQTDGVLLIVSGRDGDRGDAIGLDLKTRYTAVKDALQHDDNIIVSELNENDIPVYPDGWIEWLRYLDQAVEQHVSFSGEAHIVVYCGEAIYQDKINELRPQWEVRLMDRGIIPLSATMIRQNPIRYWQQIAQPFRRYFQRKVLILDSESQEAKRLAQDLALVFGVSPYTVNEMNPPIQFIGSQDVPLEVQYHQVLVLNKEANKTLHQEAIAAMGDDKVKIIGNPKVDETYLESIYREAKHCVYPLIQEMDSHGVWQYI